MRGRLCLVVLLSLACAGCAPLVDLSTGLEVLDLVTGWADAGIVNGENKLVPTVSFKLKNVSEASLVALQVNAVFRRTDNAQEHGSGYLIISRSEGLAPGETTKAWTVQSPLGHTSPAPRADMLKDARFIDIKIELFAKYASAEWVRIVDQVVERRLLEP